MPLRGAAFAAAVLAATTACAGDNNPWARMRQPSAGPAQVIGSPAAGCLAGGVALPAQGDGWQEVHPGRNRFFAHPATIAFVEKLARAAAPRTLLVGDLSQPRGGPMPFGHGSHQSGLDVDIWFRPPQPGPQAVSMVLGKTVDPSRWSEADSHLLQLAAGFPEVDRLFVNPAIKTELCRTHAGAPWLAKLRPWWGHDEHFHVRLSCPPGAAQCVQQAPVPAGDGCGEELASWFEKPAPPPGHAKKRDLPAACVAVLGEGG